MSGLETSLRAHSQEVQGLACVVAEVKDFLFYELRKRLFLGSSFLLGARDEGQWTEFLG